MTDLITRLSKLDAPDREVDAEIAVSLDLFETRPNKGWPDRLDYGSRNSDGSVTWPGHGFDQLIPRYTASVDAATALAERVLPGWYWGITQGDDGEDAVEFQGNVWPSIQPYPAELEQYGYHKFPAIALLIAILRAKEASNAE